LNAPRERGRFCNRGKRKGKREEKKKKKRGEPMRKLPKGSGPMRTKICRNELLSRKHMQGGGGGKKWKGGKVKEGGGEA